jgi:hypothetical protein
MRFGLAASARCSVSVSTPLAISALMAPSSMSSDRVKTRS